MNANVAKVLSSIQKASDEQFKRTGEMAANSVEDGLRAAYDIVSQRIRLRNAAKAQLIRRIIASQKQG